MTKLFLDGPLEVSVLDDNAVFEDAVGVVVFPWKSAIEAAQALVAENHRRREEAEKRPKRWHVSRGENGLEAIPDYRQDVNREEMEVEGGQLSAVWLWAKDEKEAINKARELAVSLNVLIQEYLRP